MTTSYRCRTSGSIRGTRRGTWRFICWRSRQVDSDFAKSQLDLILRNDYLHPNGQMPAYEWNFGDVNPPVHAYATMQIYLTDKERNNGKGDLEFLVLRILQTAGQLHLVAQPQGPFGKQCIRGRLPGSGQYRRVRPQLAAADRRLSGTG